MVGAFLIFIGGGGAEGVGWVDENFGKYLQQPYEAKVIFCCKYSIYVRKATNKVDLLQTRCFQHSSYVSNSTEPRWINVRLDLDAKLKQSFFYFQLSVTDIPAYWKTVPKINAELYKTVKEMDFGRKIKKTYPAANTAGLTDKREALLRSMQADGLECAAMMVFCSTTKEGFKCNSCLEEDRLRDKFESFLLTNMYSPKNREKKLEELQQLSSIVLQNLDNNPDLIIEIALQTTKQSDSTLWKDLRRGRITASILRDVCATSLAKPSKTLIDKICYPSNITSPAIMYGKKYEQEAINTLFYLVGENHQDLQLVKTGFHISQEFPFMGASPDAIFTCKCHGIMTVEVKCPYSARNADNMRDVLIKLKKTVYLCR